MAVGQARLELFIFFELGVMNTKHRSAKLNILEPWEFGTEKAIDVTIVDKNGTEYLFSLITPLPIRGKKIEYLIGQPRDEQSLDILSDKTSGTISLNMVYAEELNAENFGRYSMRNFRGNFLLGEIIV